MLLCIQVMLLIWKKDLGLSLQYNLSTPGIILFYFFAYKLKALIECN